MCLSHGLHEAGVAESRWARTWRAAVRCNVEGVLRVGGNAARAGVNASGEVEVRYAYPEAAKDAAECYDGVCLIACGNLDTADGHRRCRDFSLELPPRT